MIDFFLQILNLVADFLGGSYPFAIIFVTLFIRLILYPIVVPSLRSQRRMVDLKPEIEKLKKKHGKNKEVFAKKQMELYQKHGINPLGGCLPQLVQIGMFILFYQVLLRALELDIPYTTTLLWFDVTQQDSTLILPLIAGAAQFVLGLMLLPGSDTKAEQKQAAKTTDDTDDNKAVDLTEMSQAMQGQMVYVMPVITVFFAYTFPSGLALYWVTSTLFSVVQQYFVSGLGGLNKFLNKLRISQQG